MPHREPNATSSNNAPISRPISSAWFANQLTGLFQVSATAPPMAVVTLASRVSSSARCSCDQGLV